MAQRNPKSVVWSVPKLVPLGGAGASEVGPVDSVVEIATFNDNNAPAS